MPARRFEPVRRELLERRRARQREIDAGRLPDFLPETRHIRDRDWTVAPIRPDLLDRRVEITGPVERKMMINALNSGANVFMVDFEDANAPTWENNLTGQQNVRDAVTRTIAYTSPEGKRYALEAKTATLVVRPRGWHLVEKHLTVDGQAISASLFDFGLTFFHTATKLAASGSGPYFYLPKLESHLEGAAVPSCLCRPGRPHLSPPRDSRAGGHGGTDPHQAGRGAERTGTREGPPGQAAGGAPGARRHLGGAPWSRPGRPRGVRH